MSQTILRNALGWIINHKSFIEQQYEVSGKECDGKYRCPDAMFDIKNPFMMDTQFKKEIQNQVENKIDDTTNSVIKNKQKRKRKLPENAGEIAAMEFHNKVINILEKAHSQLISLGLQSGFIQPKPNSFLESDNNTNAREFNATKGPGDVLVTCTNKSSQTGVVDTDAVVITEASRGQNLYLVNRMVHCAAEKSILLDVCGAQYIIPPRCSFLMSDMSTLQPLLHDQTKYSIIVLDPPWQNKSIKRKKMYNTISDDILLTLPLQELLGDQGVVVIWVTNKQRQHRFVIDELFPKMKIHYKALWFWLKVTKYGEPVTSLQGTQKKPYECLILGTVGDVIDIPKNQVIVSVPSALHSQKPPLQEVLVPFVKECLKLSEIKCLELFARNLTPGWTSWGNEVIKHQHHDYFTLF